MKASSFGIREVMTMDFKHEDQAVLMQYGGGDVCPSGKSLPLNTKTISFQRIIVSFCLVCLF